MNESYDFEDEMELEEMEVERLESVETDFSHSLLNLNWSNYYNINEKEQVTEILEDMQFGIFSQRFADECIDIDSFLKLTPFHIAKILHDVPTGIILKFETAYYEWKQINDRTINQTISLNSSVLSATNSLMLSDDFVKNILESSEEGNKFLNTYNTDILDKCGRSKLIRLINSYCAANKIALGVTQVSAISKQICSLYSRETIEEYFGYVNGKYSGAFYTAHNNMLKKLRSENLIPSRKRKRESKIVDQILPETLFTSDELASNEFVKRSTANIDTKILIDHWRKSSKLRLEAFKNEKSSTVLSQYRALQRPYAIILIDIDFTTLHPLHSDFKSKWMEQENKLITILQTELKGKQKQKLNSLEVLTRNQKTATIIASLHHALYTPTVQSTLRYKSTINETIDCMLLLAENESTSEERIKNFLENLSNRKLTAQAYIVCYGKSFETLSDRFSLYVENIHYLFEGEDSLLNTLSCLIQIFHVFNLNYPILNCNVHIFLSAAFCNVSNQFLHSKVERILKLMK